MLLQGLDPVPIMQQFRGGSLRSLTGSIFFLNMKPEKEVRYENWLKQG